MASSQEQSSAPEACRDGGTPESSDDSGAAAELTVDEIIEKHVGALGTSQLVQVFLVSLLWIFDSQSSLVTIFSDEQPKWRCDKATGVSSSGCTEGASLCILDGGAWEWVDGSHSSIVAEWGLFCGKKFLASLPATLFFIGSLIGSLIFGRLADNYIGRKKSVLLSCVLTSAAEFVSSFSPNVWVYAVLRFVTGVSRSGVGTCSLVLANETVGRKWRGQVGQCSFVLYPLGSLVLPLIAYLTRTSWRNLYRVVSVLPLAYSVLIIPFVHESPRWLAFKGRKREALWVLAALAKRNGKSIPTNLSVSTLTGDETVTDESKNLWSSPWARKRIAACMVAGIGVGFVYYGVQLNVGNLNFNTYFAVVVNALVDLSAIVLGGILLSFVDRRVLFSTSAFATAGACLLCIVFAVHLSASGKVAQLIFEAVSFLSVSLAYAVLLIYCCELFPTSVRNMAVSLVTQGAMLGAAVAPVIVVEARMRPALSFLVFSVLSAVSGAVTLWLPETRDAPLHETLEQQEKEERRASALEHAA